MSSLSSGLAGVRVAKYGTWTSPIEPGVVAAAAIRLHGVAIDGSDVYWLEGRPLDQGRNVLVRRSADGFVKDATPPTWNVRTRAHEYGGGAFAVRDGTIYAVNFSDQRLYRLVRDRAPEPLTPNPQDVLDEPAPAGGHWRYADLVVDARHDQIVCVREDHTKRGEPQNTLVRVPLGGRVSEGDILASGFDFYSSPAVSPDGQWLAWLAWRHPNMPWDGCELWLAPFAEDGTIKAPRLLAGGPEESIYQPGWSPDGKLYFVSDRDGWWKPYRFDQPSDPAALPVPAIKHVPHGSEFGRPQWMFGTATWAFAGESRLVCAYTRAGSWQLATVDLASGTLSNPIADLMPRPWLAASGDNVVLVTGSTSRPDAVVRLDLSAGRVDILRVASERKVDPAYVSVAEAITFPSTGNRTAHAFYYAPKNREYIAPAGERPPLIVISHGGPTSAASPTLDLEIQFWTTRGFAVVDVNYGGSSGYGREYRELLNGQWGVVDVQDCINAGRYLAGQGKADRRRMVIRGGSAGGYTTLAALTFHPTVFTAGASYYGISDLEALARDSHKFESRSLDTLVGPYPAMRDLYRVRSPIHYADRLACPLILFQGLEDKVVPPQQSEMMAAAVRAKGLQVVHLTFAGEQHGFRKGETILRCLSEELKFYRSVLGE